VTRRSVSALAAVLLLAAGLPAQTKEVVEEVGAKLDQLRIAARHADERNEDVEILRRLLNKSLGLDGMVSVLVESPMSSSGSSTIPLNAMATGSARSVTLSSTLFAVQGKRVSQAVGPFDGVYLKGAGVVYTLRIPAGTDLTFDPHTLRIGVNAGCSKCHQDAAAGFISHATAATGSNCTTCHTVGEVKPGVQPVSDWEQTKRQLRGDQPKEPEPKKADKPRGVLCDPGSLAEQITAQLSANARNVRHLGEKEVVTVVVTFDELPGAKSATVSPPVKIGLTPEEVQELTLGDLHLKQGKHAAAVEAYLKGLVRFKGPIDLRFHSSHMTRRDAEVAVAELQAGVRSAYKSLAAAYMQLNQLDDAREAMGQAASYRFADLIDATAAGAGERKPVGPAKLILSVAKADLMTKDAAAFKKAVAVERLNFPPAPEKKVK
jgi:hypothetical protein